MFALVAEISKPWLRCEKFGGSIRLSIATDVSPIHEDARFPKHVTDFFAKVSCIA